MAYPLLFDLKFSSLLSLSLSLSSSWALTFYVVAIATSLVGPLPLSPRRRHYCCANACLIAHLLCQRLVVALSSLSPRQCLSCHAGASLVGLVPLLLRLTCAGWLSLRQLS